MKIFLGYGYTSWTTGAYWEDALRKQNDVERVQIEQDDIGKSLSTAGPSDVFLYIESGNFYFPRNIEKLPIVTACYLIDVHIDLPARIEIAKFFDVVFVAQKEYIPAFQAAGIKNVWWIPFGCAPEVFKKESVPYVYDIGFVGKAAGAHPRRKKFLSLLSQRYRVNDYNKFYFPRESAQIYSSSKIVFNCSAKGDLNMRVFEALSCGSLLITDAIGNGLTELFEDRKHLVLYRNEKELLDVVAYYLSHEEERNCIAQQGMELTRSLHTYDQRVEKALGIIKAHLREGDYRQAYFRNAQEAEVSRSRCKIYFRCRLLDRILKEWHNGKSVSDYLLKGYYVLLLILVSWKNKVCKE